MAHTYQHQDPNLYNMKQAEIEVEIEDEQETVVAEERHSLGEFALGFIDEPRYQGFPNHQSDMNLVICIGFYITNPSQGSHQSSGQLQLEGRETLAAGVPQPAEVQQPQKNTRPQIRRGVTPWQLREMEGVFEADQYPNVITKKNLARRLYMKESEAHCWFKKQRANYRKKSKFSNGQGVHLMVPKRFLTKGFRGDQDGHPTPGLITIELFPSAVKKGH